ncbi:MAG: hypothetical protein AUG49_24955 [Catenulispora sp. 13_1_20CM_3_70_7]|nr:MAG: hypothetical protein AUG49_24955 [Catenulispora sp. 13_1_20CM_3_70_7]
MPVGPVDQDGAGDETGREVTAMGRVRVRVEHTQRFGAWNPAHDIGFDAADSRVAERAAGVCRRCERADRFGSQDAAKNVRLDIVSREGGDCDEPGVVWLSIRDRRTRTGDGQRVGGRSLGRRRIIKLRHAPPPAPHPDLPP